MVINKKVESGLPLPTKIMSVIPLSIGVAMIYSFNPSGVIIGGFIVAFCLGALTAQGRITVDFENKVYRNYIWFLGFKFGKRKKMFAFERITLTNKNEYFRETNWSPFQNRMSNASMYSFRSSSSYLNIRNKN